MGFDQIGMLAGAASLRLLMRHWEKDQALENSGRKILYAVDTSVLQLFIAPDREKPGLFFVNDEAGLAAVTAALARFIFFSLQPAPLLVIPPHDAEMAGVFEAISCEARQQAHVEVGEINRLLPLVMDGLSPKQAMEAMLKKAPAVVSILFDIGAQGPVHELVRYRELLEGHRLQAVLAGQGLPSPERADWVNIDAAANTWYGQIRQAKTASSRANVVRDASVMAYIEWLNGAVFGENKEIHLIAYDDALLSVSDRREGEGGLHFVRDPRYFMMASWLKKEQMAGDVIGWIDEAMLALCPREMDYVEWLRQVSTQPVLRRGNDQAGRVLSRLHNRLAKYAHEISVEYGLTESSDDGYRRAMKAEKRVASDDEAKKFVAYLYDNRDQLDRIIKKEIEKTIHDIDRLSVKAGFYLIAEADHSFRDFLKKTASTRTQLSGVPRAPVWFRFFDIADWARKLYEALAGSGDLESVALAFDWPGSDVRKQYEVRIVHAYILSLSGHWDAAETLCRRAKAIAAVGNTGTPIYWHEAAYFRSVCLRYLATTEENFGLAVDELCDAVEQWNRHFTAPDPRFELEGLVQKFARWEMKNLPRLDEGSAMASSSRAELQRIMVALWQLRHIIHEESDPEIRRILSIQMFVNVAEAIEIERIILRVPESIDLKGFLLDLERSWGQLEVRRDGLTIYAQMIFTVLDWMVKPQGERNNANARKLPLDAIAKYRQHAAKKHERIFIGFLEQAIAQSDGRPDLQPRLTEIGPG